MLVLFYIGRQVFHSLTHAGRGLQPIRIKLSQNTRQTRFISPSQTFAIAIIFERSPKKHPYFCLYNAVWVHLNVSIGVANPDRHCGFGRDL